MTDRPFRLGFLTHVNGRRRSPRETYAELLDLIEAAEDLGFDGAFVAQHHFQAERVGLPSPLVLLAAAAVRTRRIELGTAVSTLPLEDPLRFAEDAAVLDELSGGRVQLGLGTGGANRPAFEAFGVPDADIGGRFDRNLAVVHRALEGGPVGDASPALQPPAPSLRHRLWQATSRIEQARSAARSGDGLFIGTFIHRPREEQLPLILAYRDAWEGTAPSRVGAARAVFPAGSRAEALADLGRGLPVFRERIGRIAELDGYDDAQLAERINIHYGSTEDVVDGIRRDPALLGHVDYFLPVVQHEASRVDEEIRRLQIIATEIAPALGWTSAGERVA